MKDELVIHLEKEDLLFCPYCKTIYSVNNYTSMMGFICPNCRPRLLWFLGEDTLRRYMK